MDIEHTATNLFTFLATYALHSSIVLFAVWLVTRKIPERFDRVSDTLWKCALTLSLLAPILQGLVPPRRGGGTVDLLVRLAGGSSALGADGVRLSWPLLLSLTWLLGATWGIAQLLTARRRLHRAIASRRMLTTVEKRTLLGGDFDRGVRISLSAHLKVPIALAREVCVPEWALGALSQEQLGAVIAHETAHLRRRDRWWRWAAAVMSRVFFFQPLNWMAAAKLRELAECLCDDDAIARTQAPAALASALGLVAESISRDPRCEIGLAPSMASSESLTLRRVRRMLARTSVERKSRLMLRRLLTLSTYVVVLAVLTAFAPRVEQAGAFSGAYTIQAYDPAGPFTLTIDRGRVIGATVAGQALAAERFVQHGRTIHLLDQHARVFSLTLTPKGGITWTPRRLPRGL